MGPSYGGVVAAKPAPSDLGFIRDPQLDLEELSRPILIDRGGLG
jgi:hypothetical protein